MSRNEIVTTAEGENVQVIMFEGWEWMMVLWNGVDCE